VGSTNPQVWSAETSGRAISGDFVLGLNKERKEPEEKDQVKRERESTEAVADEESRKVGQQSCR